jgi:hypothetical protein
MCNLSSNITPKVNFHNTPVYDKDANIVPTETDPIGTNTMNRNPPTAHLNKAGRPPGSRNRQSVELLNQLKADGHILPAPFLASVVSDVTARRDLRVTAAGLLAPYVHSRLAMIPHSATMPEGYTLPPLTSVAACQQAIAKVAADTASSILTITESAHLMALIDAAYKAFELTETAERIAVLEARLAAAEDRAAPFVATDVTPSSPSSADADEDRCG